ncbi:YfbM family protein [Paenibacillus campi]|uniref:YfbM family protein n=1 Tax=Paenibacillus campi TaxID=3106031 RepID=UPI002AFEFB0D|nr:MULTISPECIES: YfbM family protein [unclassified Paenibacillus]
MGMIGAYLAVDRIVLDQLAEGKLKLEHIDCDQYADLDIDKSWQAIHFMLCNRLDNGTPPQGYVVPMISEQFLEFGQYGAFYLLPEQVQQASVFLQSLTEAELSKLYHFDVLAEAQIYPIYEGDNGAEFFEYVAEYVQQIQSFYAETVLKQQGIIFYIA